FGLAMSAPASRVFSGQVILAFTPVTASADDPAIQFSLGGRSVSFSIAVGATRAVFTGGGTSLGIQTGTVAGMVRIDAMMDGTSAASRTLTIQRRPPRISRVEISSRTSSGFEVAVVGFSNTRAVT